MRRAILWICGGVLLLTGGAAYVAALLFGTLDMDLTTRNEAGQITDEGTLGVLHLQVGDCVTFRDPTENYVRAVDGEPCDEPHEGQVYAEFDVEGGVYPDEDQLIDEAFTGCAERWPPEIDGGLGVGGYDVQVLYPSWGTWQIRDRTVSCVVVRFDGKDLRGDLL